MPVTVVDHPLVQEALTALRDERTAPSAFRALARRISYGLLLEALRDLPGRTIEVRSPLATARGVDLEDLVAVPVLRAGLGMLDALTDLDPSIPVGYLGLQRDEETLEPAHYYRKLPPMRGRHALVLDPMLATGGSASAACASVRDAGPASIRFVCVVAAPEGIARLGADHPDVPVVTAAIDERLDERGYIVPGLGDFGDRLFGT